MARVSPKYSNTEIMEYSTTLIIEIGFGENTLTRLKKIREAKIYPYPSLFNGNLILLNKGEEKKLKKRSVGEPLAKSQLFPLVIL